MEQMERIWTSLVFSSIQTDPLFSHSFLMMQMQFVQKYDQLLSPTRFCGNYFKKKKKNSKIQKSPKASNVS